MDDYEMLEDYFKLNIMSTLMCSVSVLALW